MLSIQFVRDNPDKVIERLAVRGFEGNELVNELLDADRQRRETQAGLDTLLADNNKYSKQIGQLFKQGNKEEANLLREKVTELKQQSQLLADKLKQQEQVQLDLLYSIPNLPHESVPSGSSEADNEVVRSWGAPREDSDGLLPHWDLANQHGLIDFELGTKISGAGFPVYRGKGARLQRAMLNMFLDAAQDAGYEETQPPILVNEASGYGTGQLPDKEGQMYHVALDDLYLIPTAEVPLTNIYRDSILKESDFPVKLTGYTPCFRREAGSYGKHVRGLNRLHQFDKVEIVQFSLPDKSYSTLEEMLAHSESLLQKLELPYRVLRLCGGDLGFTSALTYDLEVYSPAQERWLEVSSVSNFETYQANRLKLRYKDGNNRTVIPHTLNGSALAFPRVLAAILEHHQKEGGKITLPKELADYAGFAGIG